MGQKSRVVVGSIVGAVAVHLAMLACGPSAGPTAQGHDGGGHDATTVRHDAGDILDAITAGDLGGALDAAADVVRDAVGKARDGEVRDAHAGPTGRVVEVLCTERTTIEFNQVSQVSHYGSLDASSLNPRDVPDVRAVVCDPNQAYDPCATATPGSCRVVGQLHLFPPCYQTIVGFRDGRLIINCGTTTISRTDAGATESGIRYARAFVRLP